MKRLITFGVFGAALLLLNGCDRYQSFSEATSACAQYVDTDNGIFPFWDKETRQILVEEKKSGRIIKRCRY